MKQLQNTFTTPEQSKRLLELGVPADSADCTMKPDGSEICRWHERYPISDFVEYANKRCGCISYCYCWSAGRLMEIYETCTSCFFERRYMELSVLEDVLAQIAEDIMATDECLDFSKLEE